MAPFRNGFALDTDDPGEIVRCLDWLERDPRRVAAIRTAAVTTAAEFRWVEIVERLRIALDLDG